MNTINNLEKEFLLQVEYLQKEYSSTLEILNEINIYTLNDYDDKFQHGIDEEDDIFIYNCRTEEFYFPKNTYDIDLINDYFYNIRALKEEMDELINQILEEEQEEIDEEFREEERQKWLKYEIEQSSQIDIINLLNSISYTHRSSEIL